MGTKLELERRLATFRVAPEFGSVYWNAIPNAMHQAGLSVRDWVQAGLNVNGVVNA